MAAKLPKGNLLDRAIGYFAPATQYRRVRARMATEMATRLYDGAAGGRRGAGWVTTGSAADTEIWTAAARLRDRMRDLVRNNPHAAKAVSSLVTHIIGDGITGRSNTGNKKIDKAVNALWAKFCAELDADGQLNFAGLQTLILREMIEGGDVLVRRFWRRASDNLAVPVQVRVLEADLLDMHRNGPISHDNLFSIQGIEFDKEHRRQNYWLFPAHPGNNYLLYHTTLLSVRVPANDVIHLYEKQRTQVRGVPWGAPVISKLRDLGDYDDAELMRKKIESCSVGVVTGGDEFDMGIGIPVEDDEQQRGVYDNDETLVERFEPGMFFHLRGGRDVKFHTPAPNGSYEAYKRVSLQDVAAGYRVPYELLSGDLSHVSFISGRLGLQEFHRLVSQIQNQLVIPTLCQRIWDWFIEAAITAGKLPMRAEGYPAKWSAPRMPSPNPVDDATANQMNVRNGFDTLPSVIAETTGRTVDEVLDEIKATNEILDKLGLVLDSDPRVEAAQQAAAGSSPEKKASKLDVGAGAERVTPQLVATILHVIRSMNAG